MILRAAGLLITLSKEKVMDPEEEPEPTEFQELMTAIEKDAYKAAHILYEDGVRAEDV